MRSSMLNHGEGYMEGFLRVWVISEPGVKSSGGREAQLLRSAPARSPRVRRTLLLMHEKTGGGGVSISLCRLLCHGLSALSSPNFLHPRLVPLPPRGSRKLGAHYQGPQSWVHLKCTATRTWFMGSAFLSFIIKPSAFPITDDV